MTKNAVKRSIVLPPKVNVHEFESKALLGGRYYLLMLMLIGISISMR